MLAHRGTDMGEEVGGGLAWLRSDICAYMETSYNLRPHVCVCVLQFQRKNVFKRTEY